MVTQTTSERIMIATTTFSLVFVGAIYLIGYTIHSIYLWDVLGYIPISYEMIAPIEALQWYSLGIFLFPFIAIINFGVVLFAILNS